MDLTSAWIMEDRFRAAEASGGISSDAIYACIEQVILEENFRLPGWDGAHGAEAARVPAAQTGGCRRYKRNSGPTGGHTRVDPARFKRAPDAAFSTFVAVEVIAHLENR